MPEETSKNRLLQGSITVYCALLLMLMMALIGSLLEGARLYGVRARASQVVATGLDSLFSMYDRDLYEQYGLLFLNTELLQNTVEDQLEEFIEKNISFSLTDVSVDQTYYAADDSGIFLYREVLELMKYQGTASLLSELQSLIVQIGNGELAYDYVVEQNEEYEQTDWGALAGVESEEDTTGEAEEAGDDGEISQDDIDASLEGSIITQVQELLTDSLLSLFVEDISSVSEKETGDEVSFGTSHDIAGESETEEITENLLFNEYLLSYMGSYVNPSSTEGLSYEIEYIISGEESDKENLLAVSTQLLLFRMGLNIIFLLANSSYSNEAELLAQTLVGWTGLLPLVTVIKILLIAVWAFAESILDVRALLAGKKVSIYKSKDTWNTSIADCIYKVAAGDQAQEDEGGIGYEMYLRVFLLMGSRQEKCQRTLSLIQWNMRGLTGRENFSFSECIYALEISCKYSASPVFSSMYAGIYNDSGGYEGSVRWSQTY